jgi:hypothetical protein
MVRIFDESFVIELATVRGPLPVMLTEPLLIVRLLMLSAVASVVVAENPNWASLPTGVPVQFPTVEKTPSSASPVHVTVVCAATFPQSRIADTAAAIEYPLNRTI